MRRRAFCGAHSQSYAIRRMACAKCGVADESYARFSCRDLNDKRLFRGSATALYPPLTECADVEASLL